MTKSMIFDHYPPFLCARLKEIDLDQVYNSQSVTQQQRIPPTLLRLVMYRLRKFSFLALRFDVHLLFITIKSQYLNKTKNDSKECNIFLLKKKVGGQLTSVYGYKTK